ncbi:hypothetical protein C2G38_2226637 [Gigaspora rosea]|uniref:Uncharacterized protein n=1 Tax=Gigaspora rosea TaxID=44941 RepID=A0A397U117_9GLOM|nr:hypothetical protein C2G38_2226637 [Gigaspora rosea]
MGRYLEAIIDLTKLLDIESNNKFALKYLGEACHLAKEAIIDLAKLLGIEPSDDINELLKKNLNFNFIMERYKKAIIDLTKLVDIEPSDDIDDELKEA